MGVAEVDEVVLRPVVEKRVLDLHADEIDAGADQFGRVRRVEIGAAQAVDLAFALQFGQPAGGLDRAGDGVVPPVELHEIEALGAEPLQRRLDDPADVGAVDFAELVEVGHALGVHLDAGAGGRAVTPLDLGARRAEQFLDAGVDVGAIEGEDAGFAERDEVVDGRRAIDSAVPAGKLPPAADDARDFVARAERDGGDGHGLPFGGSGTAVTAAWLNVRVPVREMRKREAQFGSGQATSASVDIQSFGCVCRCFAGRSGRSAARE